LLTNFSPHQIVYLECETTRLYAEAIQAIAARQMLWVRPLLLYIPAESKVYDLGQTADLVWPQSLFQPAFDTEVIPLISQLHAPEAVSGDPKLARQHLHHFLKQMWQKANFPSSSG
jgi:hypothetical protein